MNMTLVVQVTPRAYRAGEHLLLPEQLATGKCRKAPGRWRVLSSAEGPQLGMLRVFTYQLEPLDAAARTTAANQTL